MVESNGLVRSTVEFGDVEKVNPWGLVNFNNAERKLGDLIPKAYVDYLTKKDTPAEYKKGWITFNLGYQKEEVRIVLLAMKYGRTLWGTYNPKDENPEPLCKSSDGERSTAGSLYPADKPMLCSECKHAQWGKGTPPACQEIYSLLCYDFDDEVPFVLPVKRTSIWPLRRLKTTLKVSAKKYAYPGAAPNACVSILLRTKPVDNYFTLDFPQRDLKGQMLWQRLPEEQARELTKVAMDLSSNFAEMDLNEASEPQEVDSDATAL